MNNIKYISTVVVFFLLPLAAFIYNTKQIYNWDMLPYMAIVLKYDNVDDSLAHRKVYSTIEDNQNKKQIPSGTMYELAHNKRIKYRRDMYGDHNAFISELTYYKLKPLYTWCSYIFYKAGVPLYKSTYIPALIFSFLLLIVFYYWMSNYTGILPASIITTLISFIPGFIEIQNCSTPDAMSAFFILLCLFLYANNKSVPLLYISIALCILTRLDNILFVVVILFFTNLTGRTLSTKIFIGTGLMLTGLIIMPLLLGNSLDWFMKFKFMDSLVQYYFHCRHAIIAAQSPRYILYITLSLIALFGAKGISKKITTIIVVTVIFRLFLFPSLQERFFIAYEFGILIALTMAIVAAKKEGSIKSLPE